MFCCALNGIIVIVVNFETGTEIVHVKTVICLTQDKSLNLGEEKIQLTDNFRSL